MEVSDVIAQPCGGASLDDIRGRNQFDVAGMKGHAPAQNRVRLGLI
jgi:hypothetical protein